MRRRWFWEVVAAATLGFVLPAALGAVKIAVIHDDADTGGGDQTFTASQSIGTPQAVIFVVTNATLLDTSSSMYNISIGFTDGTNQVCILARSRNGQTNAEANKRAMTDEVMALMDGTGTDNISAEANFKSFGTDSVTVTWGNTCEATNEIIVVLFAGIDDAYCGTFTSSASEDGEVDVTAPGFEPDQVYFIGNGGSIDDSSAVTARLSFGVVDNDGASTYPQGSHNQGSKDVVSTSDVFALAHNARVTRNLYGSSLFGAIEVDNFDSSGFSSFTRETAENEVGYLALKYSADGSVDHWVGQVTTPTSTGTWSVTDPGFQPQFVLLIPSACALSNVAETDQDGGVFGLGFATANDQFAACVHDEDNVTTTNTGSLVGTGLVHLLNDDGTTGYDIDFDAFTASGWDADVNSHMTKGRVWTGSAIEYDVDAGISVLDAERGVNRGVNRGTVRGGS